EIGTPIVLSVVTQRNIGATHPVWPTKVADSAWAGRGNWSKEKLRAAGITATDVRNVSIDAVKSELPAGPRWLKRGKFNMLLFKAHLECVLTVNLGEIVGNLNRGADLIGGQEGVTAESL